MNESHLYLDLQELRAKANRRWFWSRVRVFLAIAVMTAAAYYALASACDLFCYGHNPFEAFP